jgi:TPR repeat protein
MLFRLCLAATIAASTLMAAPPAIAAPASAAVATPESTLPTDTLLARGLAAFNRGDYAAARRDFRVLARRDVPAAETLLGTMTANGQGAAPNDAVAAAWFLRAARRGYGPAQLALAGAFAEGRGVPRDSARASALARAAAGQGQPGAAQFAARLEPQRYARLGTVRLTGGKP